MTTRFLSMILLQLLLVAGCLAPLPAMARQHPAITLMDKDGDEINPITGYNATAPFSTEQTCGLCHDYETITEGYHFQMGWDKISDDYGVESGRPWSISNGLMGRWYPYSYRQLAKKENTHEDEIDLTVYDFFGFSAPSRGQLPCGACHPGGGGAEFDREGNQYDEMMADDPSLAQSLDGDYHNANWDKSGVVEADCFVCHLKGYSFEERVSQLEKGNYRWAVVGASNIGMVDGAVTRGDEPTVTYNTRLFNEDGTISLDMSWPPPDENCMFCHGVSDVNKRGFTWNDVFNHDVHNQQGISCAACHPSGLDHQFAKGDNTVSALAPEQDGSMLDCKECHDAGYMGSPIPAHHTIRPSHMASIACESCHIPFVQRAAARGLDASTGELEYLIRPADAEDFGDKARWDPDYERREDGVIYPLNSVLSVYWGNRDADGLIYPLFLREIEAGWELYSDQVTDDNEDGLPEVNTPEEMIAGLQAFSQSLVGNQRFERIQPVYLKAEMAYELTAEGGLDSSSLAGTPMEGATVTNFAINHNTAPTRHALGADGCGECHASEAHFFKGQRTTDLFNAAGMISTRNNGRYFGCNPVSFAINSFHQEIISPYVGVSIMIIIFLIVVHYHSYGPKRITFDPYSQEIERFTLTERAVHLLRLISFVILSVTGLVLAFNLHPWQELLFASPKQLLDTHIWSGVVFILTTVVGIGLWFRDAIFASYDKEWVRRIGGYLGYKGHVPSGRFNAGQKMFYWYTTVFGVIMSITGVMLVFKELFILGTICVTSTAHNLIGFVMIAGVLAHAYLGTIANPGTWRVLVDGSVTREWAHHHHPNWYRSLVDKGIVAQKDDEFKAESADKRQDKDSGEDE